MGFLSKKPKKNKIYPLKKAMEFVSENEGYSVVPENGGYRIITDKVAREHIDRYKSQIRQKTDFIKSIQTGYISNPIEYNENLSHDNRYKHHEEE